MAKTKAALPVVFVNTEEQIQEAKNSLITSTVTSYEALDKMAEQYLSLKVGDIKDLAGYNFIVEKEKAVKKMSTDVENLRTGIIKPALEFQRAINAEAAEIQAKIAPVKEHFAFQIKTFKDATAAEEQRVMNERLEQLVQNGYQIVSGQYVCGVYILSPEKIRTFNDDEFKFHINLGKNEVERKQREDQILTDRLAALEQKEKDLAEREARLGKKEQELNAQSVALDQTYQKIEGEAVTAETATEPEPEPGEGTPDPNFDTEEDHEADPETIGFVQSESVIEETSTKTFEDGFESFRTFLLGLIDNPEAKFNRAGLREWAVKLTPNGPEENQTS